MAGIIREDSLIFTRFLLLALMLIPSASLANKEEFPVCMVERNSGILDPSFFNDFSKVSMRLGVCDASWDPRRKAFLYIQNLKEFSKHLPAKISTEARGTLDAKIHDMLTPKDYQDGIKAPLNLTDLILSDVLKSLEEVQSTKFIFDLAAKSQDVTEGPRALTTVALQKEKVLEVKEKLKTMFELMHDKLGRMQESINNPSSEEAKKLSVSEKEYLRSVICRFMTKEENSSYKAFCSSENGGKDFNRLRGSLFCSDVHLISGKQREKEYESIRAALDRSVAENLIMRDPLKLKARGTTARIEIQVKEVQGPSQPQISLFYRSPGGIQQLCSILKAPEYSRYWVMKKGLKTLNPVMPLARLKLPISVEWTSDKVREVFQMNNEGDIEIFKINGRKARKARVPSYEKHFSEKKIKAKFLPVRSLVGDMCDDVP